MKTILLLTASALPLCATTVLVNYGDNYPGDYPLEILYSGATVPVYLAPEPYCCGSNSWVGSGIVANLDQLDSEGTVQQFAFIGPCAASGDCIIPEQVSASATVVPEPETGRMVVIIGMWVGFLLCLRRLGACR